MARHNSLNELFTDIATAIRNKTRDTGQLVADDFDTIIANLPSGSTLIHDKVAQSLNGNIMTTVDLGAKPKYLFLYFTNGYVGDATNSYGHSLYLQELPNNYIEGNKLRSFGVKGPNLLYQITDTGFILTGYSSNKTFCEYFAII